MKFFLQMIKNGHYLVDNNGNFVYYLEFVYNLSYYRFQLNSYALPSSLPSGWTNPGNVIQFTGSTNVAPFPTPKILRSTGQSPGNGLLSYLGFSGTPSTTLPSETAAVRVVPSGNNPTGSYTVQSILGENAPNQTPVSSVCLSCTYVDNPMRSNATNSVGSLVVTTQNVDASFGNNISHSNLYTIWMPLMGGQTIQSMNFNLTDQEGNALILTDCNTTIELLITDLRYS